MGKLSKGISPSFQFYPDAWLGSKNITLMTPAEEGAYVRLLAYCWSEKDCGLPDDDEILSRLSRLGEKWFQGSGEKIKKNFKKKNGKIFNMRLLRERKKQREWRKKCSDGGKRSVEIRGVRKNMGLGGGQGFKGSSTTLQGLVMNYLELKGNSLSFFVSPFININNNKYMLEIVRLVDLLIEGILKNNPDELTLREDKIKKTKVQWIIEMEKILRLDKREIKLVEEVIKWVHWEDDFWYQNIRSAGKLRKKFDELLVKMRKKRDGKDRGNTQKVGPEKRVQYDGLGKEVEEKNPL